MPGRPGRDGGQAASNKYNGEPLIVQSRGLRACGSNLEMIVAESVCSGAEAEANASVE